MSLAPGTSRRTSTPSRAAARSAWVYAEVADEVGVGQPQVLARERRDEQVQCDRWRRSSARPRSRAPARRPRASAATRDRACSGWPPHACHTWANAASMSATASPRNSTPVSRHGSSRARDRPPSLLTHRPLTNAASPSTTIDLRWSRVSHASGLSTLGGLKQRTSAPAARSGSHGG